MLQAKYIDLYYNKKEQKLNNLLAKYQMRSIMNYNVIYIVNNLFNRLSCVIR